MQVFLDAIGDVVRQVNFFAGVRELEALLGDFDDAGHEARACADE